MKIILNKYSTSASAVGLSVKQSWFQHLLGANDYTVTATRNIGTNAWVVHRDDNMQRLTSEMERAVVQAIQLHFINNVNIGAMCEFGFMTNRAGNRVKMDEDEEDEPEDDDEDDEDDSPENDDDDEDISPDEDPDEDEDDEERRPRGRIVSRQTIYRN